MATSSDWNSWIFLISWRHLDRDLRFEYKTYFYILSFICIKTLQIKVDSHFIFTFIASIIFIQEMKCYFFVAFTALPKNSFFSSFNFQSNKKFRFTLRKIIKFITRLYQFSKERLFNVNKYVFNQERDNFNISHDNHCKIGFTMDKKSSWNVSILLVKFCW
jgi:hypothetical protein